MDSNFHLPSKYMARTSPRIGNHARPEGWAILVSNCGFSEKQAQYKSGRELEKDGSHGIKLFFNLATPKQEHYMNNDLFLRAPPDVDGVQIYPRVVDAEGIDLPSIILMIFHDEMDRFVPVREKSSFLLRNGAEKKIRYRFETPSKSSMGKAFCVVYDIKDNSGLNLVSSNKTDPIYVQTKRGGTTTVPKPPSPTPPSSGSKRKNALTITSSIQNSEKSHRHLTRGSSKNFDPDEQTIPLPPPTVKAVLGKKRGRGQNQHEVSGINNKIKISRDHTAGSFPSPSLPLFPHPSVVEGYHTIIQSLELLHQKVDSLSDLVVVTSEHCLSMSSETSSSSVEFDKDNSLKKCLNVIKNTMKQTKEATETIRDKTSKTLQTSSSFRKSDSDEDDAPLLRQTTFGMVRTDDLKSDDVRAGVASLATLATTNSMNFDLLREDVDSNREIVGNGSTMTSNKASDINDALILTSMSSRYNQGGNQEGPNEFQPPMLSSQDSFILATQDREILFSQESINEIRNTIGEVGEDDENSSHHSSDSIVKRDKCKTEDDSA